MYSWFNNSFILQFFQLDEWKDLLAIVQYTYYIHTKRFCPFWGFLACVSKCSMLSVFYNLKNAIKKKHILTVTKLKTPPIMLLKTTLKHLVFLYKHLEIPGKKCVFFCLFPKKSINPY